MSYRRPFFLGGSNNRYNGLPPPNMHQSFDGRRLGPNMNRFNNSRGPDNFAPNRMNLGPPNRLNRGHPPNRGNASKRGGASTRGMGAPTRGASRTINSNSFGKFRNLEEFKDFRRNLKIRRSLEEEPPSKRMKVRDEMDTTLFIRPDNISELKKEIQNVLLHKGNHPEVEAVCQKYARLHYYLRYKDYYDAKIASEKKVNPISRDSHDCIPCNCYFTDKNILQVHYQSGLHTQVTKIFQVLMKVGLEFLDFKMNPHFPLNEALIAERVGILVNLNEQEIDYSGLDVTEMDQESFVLAAFEKRMEGIWPHPDSQYFCRSCNYSEFATQDLLDRHLKSARHLDFDRHYKEAFCIICQHHYGDATQMQAHIPSAEHKTASDLMEFTKKHATHYWNLWHSKKKSDIPKWSSQISSNRQNSSDNSMVDNSSTLTKKDTPYPPLGKITLSVPFVDNDIIKKSPMRDSSNRCAQSFSLITTTSQRLDFIDLTPNNLDTSKTASAVSQNTESIILHDKIDTEKGFQEIESPKEDLNSLENYIRTNCISLPNETKTEKEKKDIEEEQVKKDDGLDDFIVPLTGFMCTVCHETLGDKAEAIEHQSTNSHKNKVTTHVVLFGL